MLHVHETYCQDKWTIGRFLLEGKFIYLLAVPVGIWVAFIFSHYIGRMVVHRNRFAQTP